ncbi:hypothetical protein [Flavobacterium soli]|uniref:hypothetical protein n=1 Tax=Flavobacterium soli TaxID=344881 RepID=UPI00040AF5E6|nr:hypothetical protein [Flavobacterium soli]
MERFTPLSEKIEWQLFQSNSAIVEYAVIEEELKQLYNFCLIFQNAVFDKIKNLKRGKEYLEKNPFEVCCNYDGLEFQNIDFLQGLEEFEIPNWLDTYKFIVPMNQVLLVSIFLEKSLKSLCSEYSVENKSKVYGGYKIKLKTEIGKSKIETYINYLKENCALKIDASTEVSFFNNKIRRVRNCFVHGDWDEIEEMFLDYNSNDLFIIVSKLLEEIEKAYINKNVA